MSKSNLVRFSIKEEKGKIIPAQLLLIFNYFFLKS